MKSFVIKLFLFLIIVVGIDQVLGHLFSYSYSHAKGGISKWNYEVTKKSKANIYVFGSSRANHHYVSSIIGDSLDVECINCGLDGNGIIYNYAILKSILSRHIPDLVILDVVAGFDLEQNDNSKYLAWLRPKADIKEIDSVICSIDKTEKYKMLSKSYMWNSKFFYYIKDFLVNRPTGWDNGYSPQYGIVGYVAQEIKMDSVEIDSVKLNYLERFIAETKKKTNIIVFTSPAYGAVSAKAYDVVDSICRKLDVPYYNYYCDSSMVFNRRWFSDGFHLNDEGAHIYTQKIISHLK